MRKNVATVNVYNKMPGSPGCQIAACIRPDVDSFSFDYPGTALFAWVDGRDADGNVIFGDYYKIKDGLITLGEIGSRAVTFPSGIYTCEDISAYKAYDVEAIFDKPYGESDRTVVDYRWTPSDRSVFGNFSNAYNHALWERYDFSGKTSSDVFAEVVESIEKSISRMPSVRRQLYIVRKSIIQLTSLLKKVSITILGHFILATVTVLFLFRRQKGKMTSAIFQSLTVRLCCGRA